MEAIITYNEEKGIPVLTLHATTPEEEADVSMLVVGDFKVVIESESEDTLRFIDAAIVGEA